jgi:uncharacterized OsmC-like protein
MEGPEFTLGADRVDASVVQDELIEGKLGQFTVLSDEPPERAGTGRGPNPLKYFLAGFAFCFLTWCARAAAYHEAAVDSLEMTVRGRFDRKDAHAFTEIIYELRLGGTLNREMAARIDQMASHECYVHNTLRKAVRLRGQLLLNGTPIGTAEFAPGASSLPTVASS